MCGRAGYEYDFEEDADGNKELIKTGIRMKTEGESAFEPSLLIHMDRMVDPKTKKVTRVAHVLKDRSRVIDGKDFTFTARDKAGKVFECFRPHIDFLNLGGQHVGVDSSRHSEIFDDAGNGVWRREEREKAICLEEITELLKKHYGSQGAADKEARGKLLELTFGNRAWSRIETYRLEALARGRNKLWKQLEGIEYDFRGPPVDEVDAEVEEDVPQ